MVYYNNSLQQVVSWLTNFLWRHVGRNVVFSPLKTAKALMWLKLSQF